MRSFSQFVASALMASTLVQANTVKFVSQDAIDRTIVFTANAGLQEISDLSVPGNAEVTQEFPTGWIGNGYSVSAGTDRSVVGMLAEFTFQGWGDMVFFDVSAIVNQTDTNGVKQLYPMSQAKVNVEALTTFSGCTVYPCNTVYWHPDDVQTVTTTETDFVCTLGGSLSNESQNTTRKLVSRNHVLGKH
ncbi:DNase1 protein [Xylariaceae sp. FL1019]|nr:DNase1 protein [Xylariaceae sp. FL1019]